MEENNIFEERSQELNPTDQKPSHTASLVLGILSIVFGLLFALAGDILAIIGIVLAVTKKKEYRTTAGLVCSIIGLVVSIANHILGILLAGAMLSAI